MDNLRQAIQNAANTLPESGQPEQLREALARVIEALVILEQEVRLHKQLLDQLEFDLY